MQLQGGTPSPLTRLRSTTAPPGVYQLLVGWSLHRQHAPWALALGTLAELARLPRVSIDGFVVSPASWRLPAARDDLTAWRDAAGVPRHVQVGREDELLPVDLDAADAATALAGHDRVLEIWPPPGEKPVDADGRRVEVVVAVVLDRPPGAPPAPTRRARVPPPSEVGPEPGWRSFLLRGPRDRQDRVLIELVAPVVAAARASRELDAWFFLRYAEGARHELRLRVRGRRFENRLLRALGPAVAAGDVTTHAIAPFDPERARYGAALPAVLDAFESASDLALALLVDADDIDLAAVRALDLQALALGLDLRRRHELAAALRAAQPEPAAADDLYRKHARALRVALGAPGLRLRSLRRARAHAADLSHLLVNRLVGIDAEREAFAYVAWQRTLEGLLAKPLR